MFWSKSPADKLLEILPVVRGKYQKNVPMSKHTWFGVGGPAEIMFSPADEEDLSWFYRAGSRGFSVFCVPTGSGTSAWDCCSS